MNAEFATIAQQALGLAAEERQALVHSLVASLDQPELTDTDLAWFDLAEQRLEKMKSGGETISGDQFFSGIRKEWGWQD